ncbi:SDR family NAD(P)-dependent oxidoreductase [Agrobacterium vitis]|uniref:SDR family NAD(P)-dependent oxidoreductase n=1 Tax=Agrobacterium vitis TaxID=373 RepID=A0AAE4WAR2_AGRVI|nr:type I polyketide synthase [Agrobacterium vitis]MCF1501730.1 SDR family NAD(P)-dependent oxidoreductase [Allorhizobium sp. Av2]MCM2438763.1 SDR family NAD(P)-dependent oxidoreductase [Agrobacterium vitis]MUZ56958.1 SDR family NAD(P)-dependent oxidoreductase [Agrobacterium vitis]MVA69136.1 SDR family NAD(P)-dependent oxidoreductase [Agrobacterium vitis]MVA85906.1 SDR family NAD(P)-dependent oxidoreductase [Agrobacterium vitis]
MEDDFQGNEIAIVGIACRFPGADTPQSFWQNLIAKRESIVQLSRPQLRQQGVPEAVLDSDDYVPAGAALENFDKFDAELFNMTAKEAVTTDPQHRLFLECAWEALQAAGELQRRDGLSVGVYGGAGPNTYLLQYHANENTGETNRYLDTASGFLTMLGNDKDYVCTRTSFKLDLRGPSLNVQSACSTGLLSVHLACQALQLGECDVALAGASSVLVPHGVGYLYQQGGIVSGDGRCRSFDASADGTVFASGVGVVALKRLDDAMTDRDFVYAVIRGSAANNDGADKASFGAPSVRGQADVVRQALLNAGVSPGSVSYIETHGTGTPLGDPIEIRALSDVFGGSNAEPGSCALGAVKTNIGHLSAAAGIAGLIKAALSLRHKMIAPTLHFETLNPEISFDGTPFFINTDSLDWASEGPRRAGVTSLGVGGTNVHVVLQEAPPRKASDEPAIASRPEVLTLSAHSVPALRDLATRYRDFLRSSENAKLQDIAYSANTGLADLPYRCAIVAADHRDMAEQLDNLSKTVGNIAETVSGKIAFLFSGHGAHYVGMGRTLYKSEPVFRRWIESSAPLVEQACGVNLIDVLFPANPADTLIDQPRYAQPALLAFEYALAQLWLSRGLQPDVLIGHSLGEYTAACLAGLFEFPDALRLVATRSRLMQEAEPAGWMLAVALSAEDTTRLIADLGGDLWIAAINAPNSVVISGTSTNIMALRHHLTIRDISNSIVNTSFASHCPLMEPILPEFTAVAKTVAFSSAKIPIITNVSGIASPNEMACAQYWCDHLRKPVLFAQSVDAALQLGVRIFLEIGPRPVLANLGKLCSSDRPDADAITWVAALSDAADDEKQDVTALAELYRGGAKISWRHLYKSRKLSRVELPTYPFQRRRFWPTPEAPKEPWFHQTVWTEDKGNIPTSGNVPDILLICSPRRCAADDLVSCLEQKIIQDKEISDGHRPIVIYVEDMKLDEIQRLVRNTPGRERPCQCLITYVSFTEKKNEAAASSDRQTGWEDVYETAQFLRNLSRWESQLDFHLQVITRNAMSVTDSDAKVEPSQTAIWSLGAVFANEHPSISCSLIDLDSLGCRDAISFLLKQEKHGQYAFRGDRRFEARLQDFEVAETPATAIRSDGTYLITGGLGGIGKSIARWLVTLGAGKIVLVGRTTGDAAKQQDLALLRRISPDIRFESADVTSNDDIARVVEAIDASGFPLRGIFHAAGVTESGMFPELSSDSLERALRPKVQGAMLLDRHTRGHDLDFFVCFSSLSSMLGFRGQAAYVAANAAMEGVVTRRVQEGLPALALCWGPWEGEGMSSNLTDTHRARLSAMGVRSFPPEVGLAKLHSLLGHRGVHGAFPIDWTIYLAQFGGETPPLFSNLGEKANIRQTPKTEGKFKDDLAAVPVEARQQFIVAAVSSIVAKSIGSTPETVPADVPINRLGFDSLTTLELRNALKALGINLPLGPLFAGASINDIAQIVFDQVEADSPLKTSVTAAPGAGEPLVVKNKGVDPRLKLVCFAYAGGGPAVFNGWDEAFGSDIEVAVVQLPGRGSRLNETPYTTMSQLVNGLAPALAEYIDRPFAFFGHCIGGVQAFELTHHLHQAIGMLPAHLFVAGSRAPQIYNEDQAAVDAAQFGATAARAGVATDQDFIEMLQDVNFANNRALFKDSELLSLMLPVIKADYQLNNTYRFQPKRPLGVPITALGGRADPYTTGQHILGWQAHSEMRLVTQFFPGDHYFMETQSELLIEVASRTLAEFLTKIRRSDFRLISSH